MTTTGDVLRIHLFGGFSVAYGETPLPPLASRPARLLFALLALNAGRPMPRAVLSGRLWPDLPEARARRRLSHALWQIHDALGELAPRHVYLLTPEDTVAFDAGSPYWLDVEEFETRLDRVDAAGGIDAAGMRDLRRCVELYRGDLLSGSYEPWVVAEQERLEQRYVSALGRMIEGAKQRSNFEEALASARRLTNHAPLREDAHREVMRLCVLLGRPSEAMEQFERCRSVLLEELGAEPATATVELHERISRLRDATGPRPVPATELVSRRLVGRDEERVALVDQLERTLAGNSGTVFVEGEPGVGKTHLLVQAAEDARWRGFTVLWGTASGTGVAYGPVRAALLPALEPVRVAQLRAGLPPVHLDAAGQLLPPLRAPDGQSRRPQQPLRTERADVMRDSLVRVIVALAELEPVLLVLEDLHWSDPETLALLRSLSQRGGDDRVLVVASYRDLEVRDDAERWGWLRQLDRDARPLRLRLAPLTAFETAGLLRETLAAPGVPADFVGAVQRETGGNPLYVLELLRSLRDTGNLTDDSAEHLDRVRLPVTDGLRTLIRSRLEHLDPSSRSLVDLAAVLGVDCSVETLRVASPDESNVAMRSVSELSRKNILESHDDGYRFTHAATRRVVLSELEAATARSLHLRAAGALEVTDPDRVESLASHFELGGDPVRALPYLRLAAERALEVHAYETARTHLVTAVRLLEVVPTAVDQRFEVLAALEEVSDVLGRRDEQEALLARLRELAGTDDVRRGDVLLREASYLGYLDRFDDAVAAAEEAVELAEDEGRRGRAMHVLGRVLGWAGRNDPAVSALMAATQLLRHDVAAQPELRLDLGAALRRLRRLPEAESELERSAASAEDSDDRTALVEAIGALATLRAEVGRTDEAAAGYERAVELAREMGYRHREGVSLVNLGTVRLTMSEPGAAAAAFDAALTVFEELGNSRGVATVRLNRAWLAYRWLGDHGPARADAEAAVRYFAAVGNQAMASAGLETLAAIDREAGEFAAAATTLERALARADEAGDRRAEVQVRRGRAELALARDDAEAALVELGAAEALADDLGLVEFVSELRSLRALALLGSGDTGAAWATAAAAVAALSDSPETHRIHHRVAIVAAAAGRPAAERHHRLTALRLLEDALGDLDERTREAALDGGLDHADIVAAGRRLAPRDLVLPMARGTAPRGRALQADEIVDVRLRLGPPPEEPDERRRQLLAVVAQAERHGAVATVADLASVFDVSTSTVRRDLDALREQGHELRTRGTGIG